LTRLVLIGIALLLLCQPWSNGAVAATPPIRHDVRLVDAAPTDSQTLAEDVALRQEAVDKTLLWLLAQQSPDGGWGSAGSSSPSATAAVLWALAASGEDGGRVQVPGGATPLDALADLVAQETTTAAGTARLILALTSGGADPRSFRGQDLIAILQSQRSPQGRYSAAASDGITAQAWALLALKGTDQTIPSAATAWLRGRQNEDGGWGQAPGSASNSADTSWAMQALAATGAAPDDPALTAGLAFLHGQLTSDASFRSAPTSLSSDTTSTALAILGLLSAQGSLLDSHWQRFGQSPVEALLQLQRPDGSFTADPGSSEPSIEATAYALLGLVGRPLPLRGRGFAVQRALDWLHTQQRSDGSFGGGTVTADAVRALALAGENPHGPTWTVNGRSAVDALEQAVITLPALTNDAGVLGKVLRAVAVAPADAHDFGGLDLVTRMQELYDPATGWYHSGNGFRHSLALEGLAAVGESATLTATQVLLAEQRPDGGWGWPIGGDTSDNDTTGRVMTALVKSGFPPDLPDFADARQYLEAQQMDDGGWGSLQDNPTNSNSTALAIEGLLAVEEDPRRGNFARLSAQGALITPLDVLLGFQQGDGAFMYTTAQPESRLLAVLDTLPVLLADYPPPTTGGSITFSGSLQVALAGPGRVRLFLPYVGDDNGNGAVALRFRPSGESAWTEQALSKHGVLYAAQLAGLPPGVAVDLEITVTDPDGVEGTAQQIATVVPTAGLWLPIIVSGM
jgi:prenyltransferase beta subunit